jgi:hypothetical protein
MPLRNPLKIQSRYRGHTRKSITWSALPSHEAPRAVTLARLAKTPSRRWSLPHVPQVAPVRVHGTAAVAAAVHHPLFFRQRVRSSLPRASGFHQRPEPHQPRDRSGS